jgi:lipoprotein-anchoring transpeptidase ErfK/SrfK
VPTKYRLPNSPKKSHPIYWLLVIVFLAALGWLWWQPAKNNPRRGSNKITATKLPPVTNVIHLANSSSPKQKNISPGSTTTTNTVISNTQFPRPVHDVFEAQVALIGQGISSGSLDGALGSQTHAALAAYQKQEGLPMTGVLDAATKTKLALEEPPLTTYTITSNDLARLQPIAPTWLGKSQQTALDFENILELVAEKSFAHPNLIRRLNPGINWSNLVAGTMVQVPNAVFPENPDPAAWITIHLAAKTLEAFDSQTNLLVHFPCSIARRVEKRPIGLLHVEVIAPNPNYTFDPEVFPESAEAKLIKRKLILPPGPNNPVGVAWVGLDRPGYGMHGTPHPEEVGRTESHGCFRLANWNAEYLVRIVRVGTPVYVVN